MGIIDNIYENKKAGQDRYRKDAINEAGKIANILGEKFGATKVILYGSFSREGAFDIASDIDIAVKGIEDRYLKAYGHCLRVSRFNIDLKAYEDMPLYFRRKVDKEGKVMYAKK